MCRQQDTTLLWDNLCTIAVKYEWFCMGIYGFYPRAIIHIVIVINVKHGLENSLIPQRAIPNIVFGIICYEGN